ncbi:response regulator transcription factor [Arachnia propionica]|uniref:response regulator transcription factor n=1 Tax=Arachnia propionica TaxID=1750 RepID=UPI0030CD49CE
MTGVLRLALVDDDLMVRSALTNYLMTAPDLQIVLSTDDASQVIRAVEAGELDLVIMDVHMPGLDGIEATARIKEVSPDLPVLVLTTFDEDSYLLGALAAGASGFLLKDIDPQALIDSIRVAAGGGRVVAPKPTQRLLERVMANYEDEQATPSPPLDLGLTEREITVVREVCRASSNRQIARSLHLSEATVKSYLSTIMEKLGVDSRLAVALRAFEVGLVEPPGT